MLLIQSTLSSIRVKRFMVVSESGCGKSTLKPIQSLKLIEPTAGHIIYDGKDITSLNYP